MGKRANQEGSVYKRQDGRWVASIVLENGKRKSVYCKTQQEAIKAVRKANQDKDQGLLLSGENQTLDTFLTTWLQDTIKNKVRARTHERYRELMELHVLPVLGKVQLQKLLPQHLQKLYNQKLEEGYAPQTVKHIHRGTPPCFWGCTAMATGCTQRLRCCRSTSCAKEGNASSQRRASSTVPRSCCG